MTNIIRKGMAYTIMHLVGNRESKGIQYSNQVKLYKKFSKLQWNSLETNIDIQKRRLYNMVCYVIENVPYYQSLGFDKNDFKIDTIFNDIKNFPIMTKDIIRKEKNNLITSAVSDDWTYTDTSGGTTGEPVSFLHSGKFFDNGQASKILFDEWGGRHIGDSQVRLWGSERDIISGKKDWMNRIYRWSRNEIFLNSFVMTEENMQEYILKINKLKPKMILAYVQSARELAKYIKEHHLSIFAPEGIMVSAGTLDQYTYDLLKSVFHCPILNRYGSREMGDMACSCEKNEGLHINPFTTYIEVLNESGQECEAEELGRIVVTSLAEKSMPLIRYEIGDVGVKTLHRCSCGRGFPLLKSVNGRTVDIFKTKDGKKVDGEYFTHLFYGQEMIKQFQVIQEQYDLFRIKLVFSSNYQQEELDSILKKLNEDIFKVMGKIDIKYEMVETIPVSKSGKRAYTISLI